MGSARVVTKYDSSDLLLLRAVTNLHVGVGAATRPEETVDLPFQRDWMGFPTIYASSLKGAIKSAVYSYDTGAATRCFGPDPDPEGALSPSPTLVTDGYLLFIPARSLVGVYVYLTCPVFLGRLLEFVRLTGKDPKKVSQVLEALRNSVGDAALCSDVGALRIPAAQPSAVINESLLQQLKDDVNVRGLKEAFGLDAELLVVKSDLCLSLANKSLIRVARVRLKRQSKTVEPGGLWTEEYVPPGTFFFAAMFSQSKVVEAGSDGAGRIVDISGDYLRVKDYLKGRVIPVGGKETVGSGLVEITFW